jgi:hypothetical protein
VDGHEGYDQEDLTMRFSGPLKHEMKKLLCVLAGIAVLGGCRIIPSERTSFCFTCHRTEGVYKNLDVDASYHADYKENNRACIACHDDKSLGRAVQGGAHEMKSFWDEVTSMDLYAFEVYENTDHDARCLSCHSDVMDNETLDVAALPAALQEIGLRYDHALHWAYKDFSAEERNELQELSREKADGALSKGGAERLALLEKIKRASCAQCHERSTVDESGEVVIDKSINYAAKNPMLCTACHYDIELQEHPGKKREQLPSEESCRRCHDGNLHGGNLRIFLADCENGTDREACRQCHPLYGQDRRERF